MEKQRSFLSDADARELMLQTRSYATPDATKATWQILSTLALFAGVLVFAGWLGPSLWLLPLIPVVAGFFVRVFVFQHDLGHRSAYKSRRANDLVGLALSVITSVPFEAWRTEHNWHHNHQGRLDKRGVDQMNSPMTLEEVPERPEEARYRIDKITPLNIFLIGAHSLLIERRVPVGFFPFREAFTDRVNNRAQMLRGIFLTLPAHIALQLLVAWGLGWWVSLIVMLPALAIGCGIGGMLFWVQHNFEETYYEEGKQWNKANVAIHGSSYLELGPILGWFTASIGLHHVHHLNPRIPNHTLEKARREIPELQAVSPLGKKDLKRSFTHLFWDRDAMRMRSPEELDGALD